MLVGIRSEDCYLSVNSVMLDKCRVINCPSVMVTGANQADSNGEYEVVKDRASWARDKPLYKKVDGERYLHFLNRGYGWTIGTKSHSLFFDASNGGHIDSCH